MHDIRNLDERGLPGGFVASVEFREAYLAQANSLGFHGSVCFVDHPIQDRSDEEMVQLADRFSQEVLTLILESGS